MIKVTLPDGKVLEVEPGATVGDVAHKIGPRLGKAALLAAAMDERIAIAIPHQAGTGGSGPSRVKAPATPPPPRRSPDA